MRRSRRRYAPESGTEDEQSGSTAETPLDIQLQTDTANTEYDGEHHGLSLATQRHTDFAQHPPRRTPRIADGRRSR